MFSSIRTVLFRRLTLSSIFIITLASCGQSQQLDYKYEKAKTPTRAQLSISLPPILYKSVGKTPVSTTPKKRKISAYGNDSYNYNGQCGETRINRRPPAGDFWLDCPGIYTIERLLNVAQLYNFLADIVYETTINITNGLDASELSLNRSYSGGSGSATYNANVYYEKYDTYNSVDDCVDKPQSTASFYRVTVGSTYSIRWCIYSDGSVEGRYYAASYASFNFSSNDTATVKSIFIEANNAFDEDFSGLPRPDNEFRPLAKVTTRSEDEKAAFRQDFGPWTMSVKYIDEQWTIQYGQELQLYLPCPWELYTNQYTENCSDEGYEGQYSAPKTSVMMVSMIADEPKSNQRNNAYSNESDDGVAVMNVIAVDSDGDVIEVDAKDNNSIWEYRDRLYSEFGLVLPGSLKQSNPIYLYDENNIQTGDTAGNKNIPEEIPAELLEQLSYTDWITDSPAKIVKPQF